jgi:peptidoglycan/LPS O-acetylase OafA/YrhL
VLGFAIAWMSRQPWSSRIRRPARELLFWGGAAGVMYCLVSSVILLPIVARTIILAPALIGLCFGAMVLAAVSGSGSYSAIVGRPMWRPLATGSYTLYLTHMMVLSLAAAVAARVIPLADGASLTARWMAFLPWYLAMTALSAYVLHRYVERPVLQWRDRCLQASPRESRPATIAEAA